MNLACETEKGWLRFLIFFIKMHLLGAPPSAVSVMMQKYTLENIPFVQIFATFVNTMNVGFKHPSLLFETILNGLPCRAAHCVLKQTAEPLKTSSLIKQTRR